MYALADQLYDIDEAGLLRGIVSRGDVSLEGLSRSISNSVKYYLVTPRFFIQGIDQLTKDILAILTTRLRISAITFTTYKELTGIKDSSRVRNVFFHIVQTVADVKTNETPLFDVFVCIDGKDIPDDIKEQYLVEQIGRFSILTK